MNILDQIIAFEIGDLYHDEICELFQDLVNTGLAWTLQGSYGRTAMAMLEAGDIHAPEGVAK